MKRTSTRRLFAGLCTAVAIVLVAEGSMRAQSYSRGQNVSPAYEGWEPNADGSFNFLFGYMNRNWEEEIDVPVGSGNGFEPGPADRGQPTRFLPRRNRFVFKVRVPADWGDKELVWTLTTKGKTERAYATLRTDYMVDHVVIASETGALGAGTSDPETRANTAPAVAFDGPRQRQARVGQPLTLVATVTDDGIPKSRFARFLERQRARAVREAGRGDNASSDSTRNTNPIYNPPSRVTVGKTVGLHLSWFVFRGAGAAEFDPPQVKVWEDTRAGQNSPWAPLWVAPPVPDGGKYTTTVTFADPGVYVLRARADDGALYADVDVTVTVTR